MSVNATFDFAELITHEDFSFSNCTEASLTWQFFTGMRDDQEIFNYPQELIYSYVVHSLKDWRLKTSLQAPPMTEAFFSWAFYSDADVSAKFYTYDNCPAQLCEVVGWTGSPDLAGPGVRTTSWERRLHGKMLTKSDAGHLRYTSNTSHHLSCGYCQAPALPFGGSFINPAHKNLGRCDCLNQRFLIGIRHLLCSFVVCFHLLDHEG